LDDKKLCNKGKYNVSQNNPNKGRSESFKKQKKSRP